MAKKNSDKNKKDLEAFDEHLQLLNERQIDFLTTFIGGATGLKGKIFVDCGISKSTFYSWLKKNPSFAICYQIADSIVQEARFEWCLGELFNMASKGSDTLFMGEVIKNAPLPAMVRVEVIKTIMKTTRAGKLALSPNIPEQNEEKPKTKSLDDILEGFIRQQPHSRGIEAFDQKEAKKDEGQ